MSAFRINTLAWAIATALALPAHAALAADEASENSDTTALPTVTVTAQKREESLQDVPSAISVVGAEDISHTGGGFSAGQALRNVPNAIAPEFAGHQRPRWYIRGMGSGDMASTTVYPVGIYTDDVYIDPHVATGFPLFDMQRVEVLRGPQGTLWGKNTTGGAINFVTQKPTFGDSDGYFKLDLGNYNSQIYEGAYGTTLVKDKLAARVAFIDQSSDGQLKNTVDGHTAGDIHDQALRLQVLAQVTDDLQATLKLHGRDYNGQGITTRAWGAGPGETTLFGPAPKPDTEHVSFTGKASDHIEHNGAELSLKWDLANELTLDSITAFDDVKEHAEGPNMGIYEFGRSYGDDQWKQVSQELRLSSAKNQPLSWIVGTHLFHEQLDSEAYSTILPRDYNQAYGVASYAHSSIDQSTDSFAVFGSTTWQATDDLSLTTGLRWTRERKDIDLNRVASVDANGVQFSNENDWWKHYTGTLATTVVQDEDRTWNKLTYDITPEYQLNDNARVYFRYAKGFRSGGFAGGATSQAEASVVAPENVDAYELGVKSEWFEERLTANANLFYYDYSDIQVNAVSVRNGDVVSLLTNSGKGVIKGAELELEALPVTNLHLNASAGLLHTELQDFESGGVDYSGNRIARSPSRTLAVGASYRIPLNNGDSLTLNNDWRYQSRIYFLPTSQEDHSVSQGGYTLGNASATYHFGGNLDLDATAYVNNLTDKEYKTDSVPLPFDVAWDARGSRRTFGLSLLTRF